MPDWKRLYSESLRDAGALAAALDRERSGIERVLRNYPALVNGYYLRLCLEAGGPITRQVVPDLEEISESNETLPEDPVGEERWSPVPNLTHRYRDRVLFLVSDKCPVYCRFCTRKRKVGRGLSVTEKTLDAGFRYIEGRPEVRDVLLSGGDPLMLDDSRLESILDRLRNIKHVQIVRIGSRVPAALPQRVTSTLSSLLRRFSPLYVHTHFNHARELTWQAREACGMLVDNGIPLANQTVLLRGVNDDADSLQELFQGLLTMRIRPYYLFQVDMVRGTTHFRTPLLKGLAIIEELRKRTSPMAIPNFVVDLPDSAGKTFPCLGTVMDAGSGTQAVLDTDGNRVPYKDPV